MNLMQGQPDWISAAIDRALADGKSHEVSVVDGLGTWSLKIDGKPIDPPPAQRGPYFDSFSAS